MFGEGDGSGRGEGCLEILVNIGRWIMFSLLIGLKCENSYVFKYDSPGFEHSKSVYVHA